MNAILVVEDEESLARALKDTLTLEGYTVDVAVNGEEAIEHIRRKRPNIILLDLLLPKKGGFYVLEEIKKSPEWKTIPVIVLSNLSSDTEIKEALRLGADDYLVKAQHPIQEVVEKVQQRLQGQ